jgi:hypothetical protein
MRVEPSHRFHSHDASYPDRGAFHRRDRAWPAENQRPQPESILFDVHYEDGTRTSNRKVPSAALGGLDGDAPAQAIIETQDQEIAMRSGRARGP